MYILIHIGGGGGVQIPHEFPGVFLWEFALNVERVAGLTLHLVLLPYEVQLDPSVQTFKMKPNLTQPNTNTGIALLCFTSFFSVCIIKVQKYQRMLSIQ